MDGGRSQAAEARAVNSAEPGVSVDGQVHACLLGFPSFWPEQLLLFGFFWNVPCELFIMLSQTINVVAHGCECVPLFSCAYSLHRFINKSFDFLRRHAGKTLAGLLNRFVE
jgi:hypothetical protein